MGRSPICSTLYRFRTTRELPTENYEWYFMVTRSVTSPRGEMAAARVLRTRGGNSLHVRVMPWTDFLPFTFDPNMSLNCFFLHKTRIF